MSVVRVNKTKNYTVMSNYHLREKGLSLKAKGLLSLMLSLPDDWDYSIVGLVSICKENRTAIQTTLKELEEFKYLKRTRCQDKKGRFYYVYDVYEKPQTENLHTDVLCAENVLQLNTKELNTKELNTSKKEKKESISEKPTPKKERRTYNQVIEEYTDNENLRTELKEFLKVLKLKNSLPTNYSLDNMLNNLSSLAYSDEAKIAIVKQSIIKSWKDFYPINHLPYYTNKQTSECEPSYDLSDYESDDILEMYVNPD